MKIVYLPKLKKLATSLAKALGIELTEVVGGEETLFVGFGLANEALKKKRRYSKTWEIGSVTDSFDYLRKVILNEKTVEAHKRKKCPEKIVAQKFDYDCGGAMICTTLLMLNREDVLKTDVYGRLEVNPVDGTKSKNIKKLFEEERIPYVEIWSSSLKDLESILDAGGIGLISYQAEGTDEEIAELVCGHYSIVFDIDEDNVWLIDPSYDEDLEGYGKGVVAVTREEFLKRWIDKGIDGEIYDKWLLAVRVG